MAKRLDSRYRSGVRNGAWVKHKHRRTEAFVVSGWMPAERRRPESLLLARVGSEGRLEPAGSVPFVLAAEQTAQARRQLEALLLPPARRRQRVRRLPPELRALVAFHGPPHGPVRDPILRAVEPPASRARPLENRTADPDRPPCRGASAVRGSGARGCGGRPRPDPAGSAQAPSSGWPPRRPGPRHIPTRPSAPPTPSHPLHHPPLKPRHHNRSSPTPTPAFAFPASSLLPLSPARLCLFAFGVASTVVLLFSALNLFSLALL